MWKPVTNQTVSDLGTSTLIGTSGSGQTVRPRENVRLLGEGVYSPTQNPFVSKTLRAGRCRVNKGLPKVGEVHLTLSVQDESQDIPGGKGVPRVVTPPPLRRTTEVPRDGNDPVLPLQSGCRSKTVLEGRTALKVVDKLLCFQSR